MDFPQMQWVYSYLQFCFCFCAFIKIVKSLSKRLQNCPQVDFGHVTKINQNAQVESERKDYTQKSNTFLQSDFVEQIFQEKLASYVKRNH